jgi:soluble P-type ATPase
MADQPFLDIAIPGRDTIKLKHLVLDFTGTLARQGQPYPEIRERLWKLTTRLGVIVATADSFGTARESMAGLPLEVRVIRTGADKAGIVKELGAENVVTIGNGRNDVAMMEVAALGIAVIGPEGAAGDLIRVADIVVNSIGDALGMLEEPRRITATLRS